MANNIIDMVVGENAWGLQTIEMTVLSAERAKKVSRVSKAMPQQLPLAILIQGQPAHQQQS